jgi:hypothetical protein
LPLPIQKINILPCKNFVAATKNKDFFIKTFCLPPPEADRCRLDWRGLGRKPEGLRRSKWSFGLAQDKLCSLRLAFQSGKKRNFLYIVKPVQKVSRKS